MTRLGSARLNRELNHDVSSAKKAAKSGPVIITARGKPPHVLMTYDEFERLTGKHRSLVDALAMRGLSGIGFEPHRVEIGPREVDLS
ncbi:type II toxin-antitoxin system Phd/YefM family antitoxin [Sinorhizobium garamanticum]|uniref:Antitoxin n=1 Tax=Sinorhizobium garamanticum TaxID=680247 RepID=A0ABY8DLT7_9HYPH|nr:type II toxin-antitoxin system Phd/YefM family antitoxin [Sinorhizobium garamanticum]WEX91267.1 type II toxin-antitoxin system Phd/YefM family antitoxin [Sinorhizobium garamanticum]